MIRGNLKDITNGILNRGTEHHQSSYDKRRVRLTNLICLLVLCGMIPILIFFNLKSSDYDEVFVLAINELLFVIIIWLNFSGQNQVALVSLIVLSILTSWIVVHLSDVQIGAPYANLVGVVVTSQVIKNRYLRITLTISSSLSFLYLNYYQITNLSFDKYEYLTIVIILIIISLCLSYFHSEQVIYQKQIDQQNLDLKEKHDQIHEQSLALLQLEKEKHEKEIELKRKDIENILANASARDLMTKNLTKKIKTILESGDVITGVKKVLRDLNRQNEVICKLDMIRSNVDEVNADFYQRLLAQHPDLSRSERELCAHMKLGMSSKELALIRNTTDNTINVAKTRVRKKMGLESNKALQQYLLQF